MDFQIQIGQTNFFFARTRVYRSLLLSGVMLAALLVARADAATPTTLDAQTQQQIQAIQNPDTQICLPAIQALGQSQNSGVVNPLIAAFAQENRPLVRRYLVEALGKLRNRAAIPVFQQALTDQDVQTRQSAVAAASLLGPTDAQALLLQQASIEQDPVVKRQLVYHLGLLHTPETTNALQTFNQDSDPTVRHMAAESLGKEAK